jgi:hypothetical protein
MVVFKKTRFIFKNTVVKHTLPWIDFSMFRPMKLMAEAPQGMQNNWTNLSGHKLDIWQGPSG